MSSIGKKARHWLIQSSAFFALLGLGLAGWLSQYREDLPPPTTTESSLLLSNYNTFINQAWLCIFGGMITVMLIAYFKEQVKPKQDKINPTDLLCRAWLLLKRHPISCALLISYSLAMVHESSWFYKEIITWFDDINNGLLLDNFSIRQTFLGEAMGRNDFRFFPLSHQDLHILSWFSPYPKIWALVSAIELITTIGLSVMVVKQSLQSTTSQKTKTPTLLLIACILYLFTSSAAYNYFQFIYSERLLTLLLALFAYHWLRHQQTGHRGAAILTILWALIGAFLKDTAILLFVVPALFSLVTTPRHAWRQHRQLELNLIALVPFFLASFIWLSLLPSLYVGDQRYDASLRFSSFELDIRTIIVLLFIVVRLIHYRHQSQSLTVIDALNLGAIAYGIALWALVGFKSTSYMALPINLIAVIDALMIWSTLISPWLLKRVTVLTTAALGVGLSITIVAVEHRFAHTFLDRLISIRNTQRSWRATFDQAQRLALQARRRGEPVNLIFSKSWFKHSDYLRSLPYDRLIYLDPEDGTHRVVDGIGRGLIYQDQPGDFFLDIDSGRKLKKYGVDLSSYQRIYNFDSAVSNGHIYRRVAE